MRYCPQQSHFQLSGNQTQRQTEFLGVLAASQVDVSTLGEPFQALCQDRTVHWTRRAEGEDEICDKYLTSITTVCLTVPFSVHADF